MENGQCAADNIVFESKIVPPHPYSLDTCHGMGEGAPWPPTILSAFFINQGMSALKRVLYFEKIWIHRDYLWSYHNPPFLAGHVLFYWGLQKQVLRKTERRWLSSLLLLFELMKIDFWNLLLYVTGCWLVLQSFFEQSQEYNTFLVVYWYLRPLYKTGVLIFED